MSERPQGVVRVERTFDAPLDAVFDAWTSPEVMRRWFHVEPDWETPEAEVDLRVGGRFRVLMRRSDDSEVSISGEFTEVDPPRRLAIKVVFSDVPSNEQLIELDFTESEGATTVLLVNSGIATDERRDAEDYGWKGCLDQLGRTLAANHPRKGDEMEIQFPGESPEYRAARNRLLEREIELRGQMEAVAAARRELPPGGEVPEDYVFQGEGPDGGPADVRLSKLFVPGKDSLAIYSFMFPRAPEDDRPGPAREVETAKLPLAEGPCPSCVALLDQLDGMVEHASQWMSFAVVARSALPRILTWRDERGWRHLRLLSSAGNTYNRDYLAETPDGDQRPMLNVFHRDGETIRHFWGSELFYAPADEGQEPRHVGTLEPLWNLFDLIPEGRPDWDEQLSYVE